MYKLFLVEDDEAIAGEIRRYLETWYCWILCCLSSTDSTGVRKFESCPRFR